ncbi:hypothetical protein Tco_0859792 [Tanacetum coccineum]|uniref:Uncharacterized protein n=1 Tax=Tanacetum coccineum TaxID=301880 RepID=A0ABQ5BD28_9ASTR
MESKNHEKFWLVIKIVKCYCEENKKEEEDKNKKKKKKIVRLKGYNNRNRGGMQVGHDSNGKLILIGKSYAEFYMEEEEKKNKKREEGECDSEPISPPREPRWSDENLAMHIWRGVCRSKGVKCHEYQLRTDYRNMTREEIKLDLLWRKVYQAEAEEEAAEATTTS